MRSVRRFTTSTRTVGQLGVFASTAHSIGISHAFDTEFLDKQEFLHIIGPTSPHLQAMDKAFHEVNR